MQPRAQGQRLAVEDLRRLPAQGLLRIGCGAVRNDATRSEAVDQRSSVAVRVRRHQLRVGGDHGAQEVAEPNIDRRAIVEGPDANVQEVLCGLDGGVGQPAGEIWVKLIGIGGRATEASHPHQVFGPPQVDREERVKDRGHQDRATVVRLSQRLQ